MPPEQNVLEKKSQKYQMVLLDIVSDLIRSFVEQVDPEYMQGYGQ